MLKGKSSHEKGNLCSKTSPDLQLVQTYKLIVKMLTVLIINLGGKKHIGCSRLVMEILSYFLFRPLPGH